MHFTVLRSTVSRYIGDKQHRTGSTSKLYVYLTRQWDFKHLNALDASTLFFPYILSTQNMVQVIKGKII